MTYEFLSSACVQEDMTASTPSSSPRTNTDLLRRLDILIGLLSITVALLCVLVAHLVAEAFVPAFLLTLLFGLGVVVVSRSLLG